MDEHLYNTISRKKKAEWAFYTITSDSGYDLGLYYLSTTLHELLSAYYYSRLNASRLVPEKENEIKAENEEVRFLRKIFSEFITVKLSRLVEARKDAWNFHQLLKEAKKLGWADSNGIKKAIAEFETKIDHITDSRHKRVAHTSKENRPLVIHVMLGGYSQYIIEAMEILDMFVDGMIEYKLRDAESHEVDLRAFITQEK